MSDADRNRSETTNQAGQAGKNGAGPSSVTEGGPAEAPTEGKGHPKPSASHARDEGAIEGGTSSATVGKTEKKQAETTAHLTQDQHGRGRRKAEERDG